LDFVPAGTIFAAASGLRAKFQTVQLGRQQALFRAHLLQGGAAKIEGD
jgi:hypothetical protein